MQVSVLPGCKCEAHGTQVLASCVGAIPDLITEGETGVLTSASPVQLAQRIGYAPVSPEALSGVSQNGRNMVRTSFSLETKVATWKTILESVR